MASAMQTKRSDWIAAAGVMVAVGGVILGFRATERSEITYWCDPVFWVGAGAIGAGLLIVLGSLLPPLLKDRRARRARQDDLARQGRANQFQGLDEIMRELEQISGQLKAELRWGKRGGLFPNNAWTKNQHLVMGDLRQTVQSAYDQVHVLDLQTISAQQAELAQEETQERQQVKQTVDAVADAVRDLRDKVEP